MPFASTVRRLVELNPVIVTRLMLHYEIYAILLGFQDVFIIQRDALFPRNAQIVVSITNN